MVLNYNFILIFPDFLTLTLYALLITNAVNQAHKRSFVFLAISKLNAIIGQNRVNTIRHNLNQLL